MSLLSLTSRLAKPAIHFKVGGFRMDHFLSSSWLGKVMLGREGEEWPFENGEPMIPLCQLNIRELSYRPHALEGIAFITVFINAQQLPFESANGSGWLLRAYTSMEELIGIHVPDIKNGIKPFQLSANFMEHDFPTFYDCPAEFLEEFDISCQSLYPNQEGIKIGGWPSLIQSDLFWGLDHTHPADPCYAFQMSIHLAGLSGNNKGVIYFGRGTKPGFENEWTSSWQQY